MTYAADGKCHNAEPGTFNHECGRPADYIGRTATGFESGFCRDCKQHGHERRDVVEWRHYWREGSFYRLPHGYDWHLFREARERGDYASSRMTLLVAGPGVACWGVFTPGDAAQATA